MSGKASTLVLTRDDIGDDECYDNDDVIRSTTVYSTDVINRDAECLRCEAKFQVKFTALFHLQLELYVRKTLLRKDVESERQVRPILSRVCDSPEFAVYART